MVFDDQAFNDRLFFPRPEVSAPPAGAFDVTVAVENASLHLRVHREPSASPRCIVLLFHGNGEVVADYNDAARAFAQAGASLAVVDFRGYGASTGSPTLRAVLEDAPLVLRSLVSIANGLPIIVMGRSLGSACAAELYGAAPPEVRGFIFESGSSDLRALVRRRGLTIPEEMSESERATFDPIPKLERGRHPLLVLHGAEDQLILPAEAERAFHAAGTEQKKLVLIEGMGHNNVSWSPDYWGAISEFVRAVTP